MLGPDQAYGLLPPTLQSIACSIYGLRERRIRMGSAFHQYYRQLLESESASCEQIRSYQDEQVALLVRHAYHTVPYYRRRMDELGLEPSDVQGVCDLHKMPVLRKEDVVRHSKDMLSSTFTEAKLRDGHTSGTTGTALVFKTTPEAVAFQWAVWWRHRARFGVPPHSLHLNFTVRPVVPIRQTNPPHWRWNLPMHQALIGMQHVTAENIRELVKFAGSRQFRFYSGYPSTMFSFVDLMQTAGLQLDHRPSCIFAGAENMQEYQKTALEAATGARVTDQYGFSEGCGNASRCERGPYHEDWEFGVLEPDGPEILSDGSRRGRILATGFANYAFPFIRYDVGDSAVWAPAGTKCECGRASQVITAVEGRNEDYVITPEGSRIMRFAHLFTGTPGIKEAQVVQHEIGAIIIRFVARESYSKLDQEWVSEQVREWISPRLRVEFERMDELPRSGSGKFRPVLSLLTQKEREAAMSLYREASR